MDNISNKFAQLQAQIDTAIEENQPIEPYVLAQIDLLQNAHDEFVVTAKEKGYDLNSVAVGEIEIKQFFAMKQLATRIGLPTEEYDKQIKSVQERILGSEAYNHFFEAQ